MAYVYQHIRLDTFEPFYIGLSNDQDYNRANSKHSRNKWWKNITSKVKIKVEIIIDNISFNEAKLYEQWYIKFYGRKDLGLGNLVNLTDGGDGVLGNKCSEENKEKLRKFHTRNSYCKGYKQTEEHKRKVREANVGRLHTKETKLKISLANKGKVSLIKGLKLSEEHIKNMIEGNKKRKKPENPYRLRIPILQYDLNGNFIREYTSIKQTKEFGFNSGCVWSCVTNGKFRKTHKKFIWKLKETLNEI